jgi:hypothetical protein
VAEDARLFLRDSAGRYDAVLVDLFQGEYIPSHCVTREFFALAAARLAPDGILAVNTNMADFTWAGPDVRGLPLRHLRAAIRAAGFAVLVHSDRHADGMTFAFRDAAAAASWRARLLALARDPARNEHLRASAAGTALAGFVVPDEEARPFTDDWVPETLLQRRSHSGAVLAALRAAPPSPAPQDPPLKRLVLQYSASGEIKGRRDFNLGESPYCRAVARVLEDPSGRRPEGLARYLIWERCIGTVGRGSRTPGERLLEAFTAGLLHVHLSEGEKALAPLLEALRLLGGNGRGGRT